MTSETYYRRSRTGCTTCRKLRIKCDEKLPSCNRCQERQAVCGGYPQRLKWIMEMPLNSPVKRNPGENPLQLTSSSDRQLLFHFIHKMLNLVSMKDPDNGSQSMLLASVLKSKQILLPSVLAVSAAHLAALGALPLHKALLAKQNALKVVRQRLSIGSHASKSALGYSLNVGSSCRHPPPSVLKAEVIIASGMLAGIELSLDSNFNQLQPILQGTAWLIRERYRYLNCTCEESTSCSHEEEPPFLDFSKKMAAYFDVMSCVPRPRKPLLSRRHWLEDDVFRYQRCGRKHLYNSVLGYCGEIFALLGECSALIEEGLRNEISSTSSNGAQKHLLDRLRVAIEDVPTSAKIRNNLRLLSSPVYPSNGNSLEHHTLKSREACAAAARAHGFATTIFLLRSTDEDEGSSGIRDLVTQLRDVIFQVPSDSSATTTMLWPLWVLGCEGSSLPSVREDVAALLNNMHRRQGFLNVATCLDTLRARIWTRNLDESDFNPTSALPGLRGVGCNFNNGKGGGISPSRRMGHRADWVRYCWEENIQVILA